MICQWFYGVMLLGGTLWLLWVLSPQVRKPDWVTYPEYRI